MEVEIVGNVRFGGELHGTKLAARSTKIPQRGGGGGGAHHHEKMRDRDEIPLLTSVKRRKGKPANGRSARFPPINHPPSHRLTTALRLKELAAIALPEAGRRHHTTNHPKV